MKILTVDPNFKNADIIYDALDNIFYYMAEYLPKLFLDNVTYNGEVLQIPRFITKQHYKSLDGETRDLLDKLADALEISKQ
jgi:hypothetical protein